jgi:tetratricopeptide (TPR) repeat protein
MNPALSPPHSNNDTGDSLLKSIRAISSSVLGDFFSRMVAFSLPVTYFLVTISFYLRTYDSAQIKITITQAGCGMVILFWALQLIFQKRWPFTKKDLPLVAPFLAILASGTVSFLHSSFQAGSLEEFSRRVFYSFMALIVIAEFGSMDRQRRLMRWLIAGFAVAVFYGFVQYFDGRLFPPGLTKVGLDPFIWRQAFGLRVFSSFGNPNFYGNFLVIITPILIALFFRNRGGIFRPFFLIGLLVPVVIYTDKIFVNSFGGITAYNQLWVTLGLIGCLLGVLGVVWWKSPSASASGMMIFLAATFINLYATETKGAWIGFIAAIVASAVIAGYFLVGKHGRRVTVGLLCMSFLIACAGLSVVIHYANQRKQSVDFRVFTWISTWDMIRTEPLLGTGIGSFKWAYPAFRRPEIILLEGRSNTETDHAEDEYLEVMYDEGMIGFGIFLWLILSVSVMGLRMLNRLTKEGPRPPPAVPFDDKVYKIIAYLGAWWAALVHWTMDVSVRFVSSGIFSFFLPALVTSFVRNDPMPEQLAPSRRMDRWARGATVCLWICFFLFPDEHFRPLIGPSGILFVGACLIVLGEFLERHLSADSPGFSSGALLFATILCVLSEVFEIQSFFKFGLNAGHLIRISSALVLFFIWTVVRRMDTDRHRNDPDGSLVGPRPSLQQIGLAAVAISVWVAGASVWRGYFLGDVSHNVAIFFSKQTIWGRSPESDKKVSAAGFPDDMRQEYELVGGALEHYEKTFRLNPGFPMSVFFIGNVHNDWGSSVFETSRQALQRGDEQGAETLRKEAVQHWEDSLNAYTRVKAFAPNYVQTHHQVGLVHLKMGEMFTARGEKDKAEEQWRLALKNFDLYHSLDPVFPPNYYRQSYVHFNRGDMDKAEEAYLGALLYNSTNVVNRVYSDRNIETYSNLGRLFYVQLVNKYPDPTKLPKDSPLFVKAEGYYLKALALATESGTEETTAVDPAKSLAVLYSRVGQNDKAKELWLKLRAWAPEDADVKRVFTPVPQG